MATQVIPAHGRDVRHRKTSSGSSLTYGPVPGSPTLTNPDMILPDYDFDGSLDDRSQSPIMMWNNGRTNDGRFHLPPSQNSFALPPSTPIIYGNGTMLSDIGEVTEVESVVGGRARRVSHLSVLSDEDAVVRSSPTMGVSRIKSRSEIMSRERRSSIESNSTITSRDRGAFADFDDAVSVDDINFQGDDEESMASSYVEGTPAQEPRPTRAPRTKEPGEERYSTSSLSDRAEQILANAKQRLTTMEGNLSRARSSLNYTPMSDGSTPSPPIVRPSTSLRQFNLPVGKGHSRMLSDASLQEDLTNSSHTRRSASALGAAGGYRQPLTSSRSVDALGIGRYGSSSQKGPLYGLDTTLEALSEDEDAANESRRDSSQNYHLQSPTFGSFSDKGMTRSVSVAQVRDLKDQMNGLKGKISSLREQAQADNLKRRSLQSLRTPSPFTHSQWDHVFTESRKKQGASPETVPWQAPWNHEVSAAVEAKDTLNHDVGNAAESEDDKAASVVFEDALEVNPENTELEQEESHPVDLEPAVNQEPDLYDNDGMDDEGEYWEGDMSQVDEQQQQNAHYDIQDDVRDDGQEYVQDFGEEEEEEEEENFVDYESESGESLYHDSLQHPVSHEDREDAFDYEHFFLHSAMGTISQQRMGRRGSWGSVSSEDSVETTRGPLPDRERRPSIDTMSSVNTFATANEGRASRTSGFEETTETIIETPEDSDGPPASKRTTFGGFQFPRSGASSRNSSVDFHQNHPRRKTVVHRPSNSATVSTRHRPSVSSFESTGTNRSFPLVSKSKMSPGVSPGVLTPTDSTPGGSPDSELKQISDTLMTKATSFTSVENGQTNDAAATVQGLGKEDQILVERLVGSLGKCVLGLTEASRASSESRTYRRRIDMARRILDGLED
ncbi:hypothetical protein FZEAL_10819 [Fusarium zealandicum]|uniref:Uncharacterized protein n=1 Tax=Fusarium zealandicum TaxID=1053134 RepID=A0A8H4X7M3_9HYPO|nr:hypothetical protein FZEAL_10819 [Fusarium zealandicum]